MNMAWIMLVVAGLLEVAWALGLKASEGFTRALPTVFTLLSMAASFYLLAQAMKSLPVGTAYAIWVASVHWVRYCSAFCCSVRAPGSGACSVCCCWLPACWASS